MTRCTLAGGFAPMRDSSYSDPRIVERKTRVGGGTTRHLDTVLDTIQNHIASEPDLPIWAGVANNEIPTELGKLLTGQDYNGNAKECMDQIARLVDAKVEEAELI
jgi:multiple sugar transport system substrate-binding protein